MAPSEDEQTERVSMGKRLLVVVEDAIYVSIAALLAIGAAVLVVTAVLLRVKEKEPEENTNTTAADGRS